MAVPAWLFRFMAAAMRGHRFAEGCLNMSGVRCPRLRSRSGAYLFEALPVVVNPRAQIAPLICPPMLNMLSVDFGTFGDHDGVVCSCLNPVMAREHGNFPWVIHCCRPYCVWSGSHPKFCKENTTDSQFSGGVMPQLMAVAQGRLVRTRVLVVTKCDDTS